jgi:hypothetical protein
LKKKKILIPKDVIEECLIESLDKAPIRKKKSC